MNRCSLAAVSQAIATALIATGLAGCVPALLAPSRSDTGAAQDQREEIVEMIRSGQLTERNEFQQLVLPPQFAGASQGGLLEVRDDPFMVFFITWTGFSPDPYCGYEYAPDPGSLDPDPLGSGHGDEELIGDSWYWICAS
jgi:hypothetical protein